MVKESRDKQSKSKDKEEQPWWKFGLGSDDEESKKQT